MQGSVDTSGDPSFTEKGFVYSSANNLPTINDIRLKVDGENSGYYDTKVSGLELTKYYVRAYVINLAGTVYSDDVISFELSGTTPIVTVSETSNIDLSTLSATLHGYVSDIGYPEITERGFVYSYENTNPTVNDMKMISPGDELGGSYSVQVGNLILDKTYRVKAYVRNVNGVFYSSNTGSFSTMSKLPTLSISQSVILNTVALTADVSGCIEDAGNPHYTEKGFVYGYNNEAPTVDNDQVIYVDGSQTGTFSGVLSDLIMGKKYYVRSFAKNAKGFAYSSAASFNCEEISPKVRTEAVTNLNVNNKTALLHGAIDDVGNPAYTERGFVLSSNSSQPTIYDEKVQVPGSGAGNYEYQISGFSTEQTTCVRAYAVNHKGVSYGETVVLFDPDFIDYGDYIEIRTLGIAVQKKDVGSGNYTTAVGLCSASTIGQYSDWRLPTSQELSSLYLLRDKIGGFKQSGQKSNCDYWSCTLGSDDNHMTCLNFYNGSITECSKTSATSGYFPNVRCVRTL